MKIIGIKFYFNPGEKINKKRTKKGSFKKQFGILHAGMLDNSLIGSKQKKHGGFNKNNPYQMVFE